MQRLLSAGSFNRPRLNETVCIVHSRDRLLNTWYNSKYLVQSARLNQRKGKLITLEG